MANGTGSGDVDAIHAWADQTGRTLPKGQTPQPGDLVIWDEHIGIVKSVGADGTINTIEGNSSDKVSERSYAPGKWSARQLLVHLAQSEIVFATRLRFALAARDAGSAYVLHFTKDTLPPVDAFWSVTLYDADGFQVANRIDRFALSSWMPLKHNPDGSLDLYFQSGSPGVDKEANWLPAPKGVFNLTMRLYAPKNAALVGEWNPPVVAKQGNATPLMAQ